MGGEQWVLFVQAPQHRRESTVPVPQADPHAAEPCAPRGHLDQFAAGQRTADEPPGPDPVASAGIAQHDRPRREPIPAGEPGNDLGPSFRIIGPQLFDAFEHFEMPPANLVATGCSTWPPPSVCSADESRKHERLSPRRRNRFLEEQLGQAPSRPARSRRNRAEKPCP